MDHLALLRRTVALSAAVVLFSAATPATSAEKVIRFGGSDAYDTPVGKSMLAFKRIVEEKTSKAVEVQLFPSLQLGSVIEQIEGTRSGSQDMTASTPGWFSRFYPKIDVLSLPYIVSDWASAGRMVNSAAFRKLADEAEAATGIKIVGVFPSGFRHVINKRRAVNTADDLKGLKLRLQDSPVHLSTFRKLGTSPIALSWGDVYQATQTGVIDGLEAPFTAILSMKFYEVAPYISVTGHFWEPFLVYMNPNAFSKLSGDQQKIVLAAVRAANDEVLPQVEQANRDAAAKLTSLGAKINEISPQTLSQLQSAVLPVYEEFGNRFEPTLTELRKAASGK